MKLVSKFLSRLTKNFHTVITKNKKGQYSFKSIQSDAIIINDFSRVAALVSSRINGPLRTFKEILNFEMAQNGRNPPNHSRNSPNRPNFHHNLPRSVSRWDSRSEESIFVVNPANLLQYSNFYAGAPFVQANNLGNFQVLHPNFSENYFHRPRRDYQRQIHHTPRIADRSLNGLRFWEPVASRNSISGFVFTLMSYNVLAQVLLDQHPYLYNNHQKSDLKWKSRWDNLLDEIKSFDPEILCLQEVQQSHLDSHFSVLEQLGYKKIFKQRTGVRIDGCAIFYKKTVISLIEHITVEYKQPNVFLLDRDNVAIIAKFSLVNRPKSEFIVATTHLLYNPKRQDVRLAQTQLLLTEIDRIAYDASGQYFPVIVTGDWNSSPNSPVYKLITRGKLRYDNLLQRSLKSGEGPKTGKEFLPPNLRITDQCQHAALLKKRQEKNLTSRLEELSLIELKNGDHENIARRNVIAKNDSHLFASGTLSHKLCLKSVYPHNVRGGKEATTFQDEWVTVDYIFYSTCPVKDRKLILLERYRLPTDKEMGKIKIPNSKLGSDHLSLVAKFELQ